MRFVYFGLLLILMSTALAYQTKDECYSAVDAKAQEMLSSNAAQTPGSGGTYILHWGCGGACGSQYQVCLDNAQTAYTDCVARANQGGMTAEKGQVCINTQAASEISCANYEIDCCRSYAKAECDSLPSSVQPIVDCVSALGPYGEYDPASRECKCPDYTFYNPYTQQCTLKTVYADCESRGGIYDPSQDACVPAGTEVPKIPSGSTPSGDGGCAGSAAVLLSILGMAFVKFL